MTYKLPEGWKIIKFEQIADIRGGKRMPKGEVLTKDITPHPYIRVADFTDCHNLEINDKFEYVPIQSFENIKNYTVTKDDIIISIVGTIGNIAKIGNSLDNANLTENCARIYNYKNNVNGDYLYYYLISPVAKGLIYSSTVGAVQSKLPLKNIRSLDITLPVINEQKSIADTLSSIDNKIELNNKINENLEQQAQAIFKHWFVDFEFPDKNGNPYKSSGGEIVESELGMIPKGWEVKKIKEISKDIVLGKTPKTAEQDNFGGNIPFLTIPDMHNKVYVDNTARTLSNKGANTQANKTLPINSICVSCIATPGLVTITKEPTQTNQQINTIIPKIRYTYVYSYMKSIYGKIISLGSGGTTTNNLNKTQFSNIDIIVPSEKHIERYHDIIQSTFNLIKQNQMQNQKLSQLRDTLLPKLMSGELRIPLD